MKAGFDNIQAHVPDDLAKVINDLAETCRPDHQNPNDS